MGGLCEERSKKGRGGRPQLRWEDCVKRDLRKTRKTTAKMGGLCEERSKKGRGGGPQLRWEECVKRDLRKAEEEDHS